MNTNHDIFKKRKSKVYKNLVSFGKYGVVSGAMLLALAVSNNVYAAEESGKALESLSLEVGPETADSLPEQGLTSVEEESTPLTSNESASVLEQGTGALAIESTSDSKESVTPESIVSVEESDVFSKKIETLEPVPVKSATFSWQAVPEATSLLENGSALQASGAQIVYESQPIFGSTTAGVLVTYPDGTAVTIVVPIRVTANAIRKNPTETVAEGIRTRAVITSPNMSGTVSGSLTADSPTTAEYKRVDNIIQTVNLSISGNQADYTGGYIEVVLDHGQYVYANPSQVSGVVIQNVLEGNKRIIRFKPSVLTGGQDYNFRFNYTIFSNRTAGNQGDMVTDLFATDFQVTTTAQFLDADGLLVQDLGSNVHHYYETLNGGSVSNPYAALQPVGYDLDKDGLVDSGATPITFFVSTGVITQSGSVANDFLNTGTGVFDGRYVSRVNPTQVEDNRLVAPVETYTHTIALKPGFTLSQASKDLGWVEDATGYHLTVTRDNNPVGDTYSQIPITFDIAGASVTDIAGTKSLALTSTYTKTDGTVYSNTNTRTHNFRVLKAELAEGLYNVGHGTLGTAKADTEIIKSYGRAYYDSRIDLSNQAMMEKKVSIDDNSFVWTTENDNEFYRRFWINTNDFSRQLDAGGVINLYNNDTRELITTITGANRTSTHYSITIPEEDQVKSIRMETQGIYLWRTAELGGQSVGSIRVLTDTFFDDWSTIYKDTSINSLWSRTQLEMLGQADSVLVERHATTELVRTPMRVEMIDGGVNVTFTTRQTATNFISNNYDVTNTTTNSTIIQSEQNFSGLVGEVKRAYLVSPELKPVDLSKFSEVIYNYNGAGKDLYLFATTQVPTVDNGNTNYPRWTFANNFVPNGSYTVTDIGYWDEVDPNVQPTDGIDLGTVNGVMVTVANSTTKINTITLMASEASGVISKVKSDAASSYALNSSGNNVQDVVDFQLTYSNIGRTDATQVTVLTSLPTNGDALLAGGNRNSQFTVSLTGSVTPPTGWTAVYSTATGTATQLEAGIWSTADQITDWSTIRAIKFISTAPVVAGTSVNFNIDNTVIEGDALQGEKAYLSSAFSTKGVPFIESNTVLIQMATTIADGSVTIKYANESGKIIAPEKVLTNDIKSSYDVSDQETYYPTTIIGLDGLPYVYVKTDAASVPSVGAYSETPQVITHVYKLMSQTATFTYVDVTDTTMPVQLGMVDSETGGSAQDILYDTSTRINGYLKAGYELVSNDYTDATTYDTNPVVDQPFTIELSQRVTTVPKGAVPGEPVDPTDPNSPVWPDSVGTLETELVQSRAIEYRYLTVTGEVAADPVVQTVNFNRKATVNLVTGTIEYDEWTSEDPIYESVTSPTIPGYTANIPVVGAVTGEPGVEIGITRVVYTPNEQVGTVSYIDETTGQILEVANLVGATNEAINYSTAERIRHYESIGYELVSDNVPTDGVYDNITGNSQDFQVILRRNIILVPHDFPSYDLPAGDIGIVPNDFPSYDLPAGDIGIVPNDFPSYDLPVGDIGIVPNDFPSYDLPTGDIGIVPHDFPSYDLPAGDIGIVPHDFPSYDLPAGDIGIVPNDFPSYDLPVGDIGIVPNDFPSYDLPVGDIGIVPHDFPSYDLPAGDIGIVPNDFPSYDLPVGTITEHSNPKPSNNPYQSSYKAVDTLSIKHHQASELPKTGESDNAVLSALGMIGLIGGLGLARKTRRYD